jgi:uncharacterized protein with PIN domain
VAERLRFHLDESVDPAIARGLRLHGVDVTTTQESGLRTMSDVDQLRFAVASQRVLVTHEADFLRMSASGAIHAGSAFCPKTTRSLGDAIRNLILMYEVLSPREMAGRVEFL